MLICSMLRPLSMILVLIIANFCAFKCMVINSTRRFIRRCSLENIVSLLRMNLLWFLNNISLDYGLSNLWLGFGFSLMIGSRGLFSFFF